MLLRNRVPWWPLHPLGLAFQKMSGSRVYAFSIFLTWASKLIILRIGGISLYRRCIPLFFGLVIGYVVGVGCLLLSILRFFRKKGILFTGGRSYVQSLSHSRGDMPRRG